MQWSRNHIGVCVWCLGSVLLAACTQFGPSTVADDDESDPLPERSPVEDGAATDPGADAAAPHTDAGVQPTSQPPSADEQQMLDFINATRSGATDAVPALHPVLWDPAVAADLRSWVGCSLAAPPLAPGSSTLRGPVGASLSVNQLMQLLADSRAFYTRDSNGCSAEQAHGCEGYTDMVQRGVSRVACVWGAICPGPAPGQTGSEEWRTWACQFAPLPNPAAKPY